MYLGMMVFVEVRGGAYHSKTPLRGTGRELEMIRRNLHM